MTDLISIIGTIASIGSIPLAIYLYLKNAEEKKDKVRRDIVRTIAFQIGNGRIPTTFEIQAIINSKCRDSKIKPTSVDTNDVIEDLVAEIISTPILASDVKDRYISTLNLLYTRGQVLEIVDKLASDSSETITNANIEKDIKHLLETHRVSDEELKKVKDTSKKYSDVFGWLSAILSLLGVMLAFAGARFSFDSVTKFFGDNKDLVNISIGVMSSLIAGLVTIIIEKYYRNTQKKIDDKRKTSR